MCLRFSTQTCPGGDTVTSDTTAPALQTATIDGATLRLIYDEDLDAASTPAAADFAVTVGSASRALASATPVAVSGRTVTLTLATAVLADDTVTVSYTVPTESGAMPIQDDDGNAAAALTDEAVTNNTAAANDLPWSATMTVGDHSADGRGFALGGTGSLDDDSLTYNGTATTVISVAYRYSAQIFVFTLGDAGGGLNASHADDLVLEVAGEELPFSAATRTVRQVSWLNTWLTANAPALSSAQFNTTLPVGDTVAVCLRFSTQTCPGGDTDTNTAATGAPAITGTAQVGETLTAGMGTIADTDGLTNSTFPDDYTFQWIRVDGTDEANITDADSSTYELVAADQGKTIKVKVSFTDDDGNSEELTSAATAAVAAAQPAVTIAVDNATATGGLDVLRYTLTREGDTTAALTVPVTLVPFTGNDWGLDDASKTSFDVTIAAGNATATRQIWVKGEGRTSIGLSDTAAKSGDLTATLGTVSGYDTTDTAVTRVIIAKPAWVVRLAERAYTFAEGGGDQTITLEAVAQSAEMPKPTLNLQRHHRARPGEHQYRKRHGGLAERLHGGRHNDRDSRPRDAAATPTPTPGCAPAHSSSPRRTTTPWKATSGCTSVWVGARACPPKSLTSRSRTATSSRTGPATPSPSPAKTWGSRAWRSPRRRPQRPTPTGSASESSSPSPSPKR